MDKIKINTENVIKKIGEGNEANVYLYLDNKGREVALKYYKPYRIVYKDGERTTIDFTEEDRIAKENKIKLLDKEICLLDDPKILDMVYDDNIGLIGYTEEYSDLPSMYDYLRSSKHKKIKLLQELRKRIEELNHNGLYIGDFFGGEGFLVDKDGSIKLIDQDNFYVHGLDFDLSNPYIDSYRFRNNSIKNVDNYGFNFFTISYYTGVPMSRLYLYVKENGIPYRFSTKENCELMDDMLTKRNYEKRYILDSQKKGLF